MAWSGETVGETAVFLGVIAFFNYLFGSCLLFIAIADDITEDLTIFNESITDCAVHVPNAENRVELMNRFRSNIQTYLDAKQ